MLEPCEGKLSRTVLRGESGSNTADLLDLQQNCYKYGFIFRYPGAKTDLTGVAEEVWHYRYVGEEAAARIQEEFLCLEEYLENREES